MTNNTIFVLDTNMLISALLLPRSITRQAFGHAFAKGTVLASPATLDELGDVLRWPKFDRYVQEEGRLRFLSSYIQDIQIVEVTITITDCRDAKDNKFLELAVSGDAACIVSGDRDLLDLAPYQGITILSPHDFLESY